VHSTIMAQTRISELHSAFFVNSDVISVSMFRAVYWYCCLCVWWCCTVANIQFLRHSYAVDNNLGSVCIHFLASHTNQTTCAV
jgi:hypothetical protein